MAPLGLLLSRWSSGTAVLEEVDFEVQRALEWLQTEKAEARRLGAVLVLKVRRPPDALSMR